MNESGVAGGEAPSATAAPTAQTIETPKKKLFPRFLGVALSIVAAMGGFVAWRHSLGVSTDDAFVRADIVQVPAEVGARVVEVDVKENQHVEKGDLLLKLDDSDLRLKVLQAEAALAAAEADSKRAIEAALASRSDIQANQLRLKDARREAKLQTELAGGGASVQSAVDKASSTATVAAQAVTTAEAGLQANLAGQEAAAARIPAARAALDLAKRELALTEVRSPSAGTASRIELQPGELVQRGQALLAIVPDERYVVANFKETELDQIQVGAPVSIRVDAFPDTRIEGVVESLAAGTGSTFSLLPPDNATGNFIKVPVRIALKTSLSFPLPAGLSATVQVERQK
jgi:membrane fusion protein, multidrug efflux system